MTNAYSMRTTFGEDNVTAGDNQFVCVSADGRTGKPVCIVAHPRGSSALGMMAQPGWVPLYQELCEEYVVVVSDCGGGLTWGNTASMNSIGAQIAFARANFGAKATGKVALVGISMGGLAVWNYAKANPSAVAVVAGIVPAAHPADIKALFPSTYGPEIDAAHGGTYTDASLGATRSPYFYRAGWPGTIKTAIWSSAADVICRPQWHQAMKDAVGGAPFELYPVLDSNGSAPAHEFSVEPSIQGYFAPKVGEWCCLRARDTAF